MGGEGGSTTMARRSPPALHLGADLVATLSRLDVDDLPHGGGAGRAGRGEGTGAVGPTRSWMELVFLTPPPIGGAAPLSQEL